MKLLIILVMCGFAFSGNGTVKDFRKHYGLSYYKCPDKIRTFKCLTACKSNGYQVFRIDAQCVCTCHLLKKNEVLPYFKWRTTLNVTKEFPKTHSVSLYHIIGSLSPLTETEETTTTASTNNCPTLPAWWKDGMPGAANETSDGNETVTGDDTTVAGTGGDATGGAGGGDATTAAGGEAAGGEGEGEAGGEEAPAEEK